MLLREFSRLAIVGRGEPAMRVMHAVRELGVDREDPFRVIALHAEADRDAWFVRYADETACLDHGGPDHALRACRADAAWVGRELASDHAEFAQLCDRLGIVFVGADPAGTRRLTESVVVERLPGARRLGVPIIADGCGAVWPLGVCDHSVQRRGQTMLAESSSPATTADQELEIMDAARRLALCAGYCGAGTLEFVYDPEPGRFSLVKVIPWPEHAVMEAVTGLDLVKLQLLIAAGGRLEGDPPTPIGYAVETHLRAEDATLGFAPAPGGSSTYDSPRGLGCGSTPARSRATTSRPSSIH